LENVWLTSTIGFGSGRHMHMLTAGAVVEKVVTAAQQKSKAITMQWRMACWIDLFFECPATQLAFVFEIGLELPIQALWVTCHLEGVRCCFVINVDFGNAIGSSSLDHELNLAGTLHESVEVSSFVDSASNGLQRFVRRLDKKGFRRNLPAIRGSARSDPSHEALEKQPAVCPPPH
jgi:hypothetical protein